MESLMLHTTADENLANPASILFMLLLLSHNSRIGPIVRRCCGLQHVRSMHEYYSTVQFLNILRTKVRQLSKHNRLTKRHLP